MKLRNGVQGLQQVVEGFDKWVREENIPPIRRQHHEKTWKRATEVALASVSLALVAATAKREQKDVAGPVGWLVRGEKSYCYVDSPEKPNYVFINCDGADRVVSVEPRFAAPMAAPAESSCDWRLIDDENMPNTYDTSCGRTWSFVEGNLTENRMHFCMECGRKISESKI